MGSCQAVGHGIALSTNECSGGRDLGQKFIRNSKIDCCGEENLILGYEKVSGP